MCGNCIGVVVCGGGGVGGGVMVMMLLLSGNKIRGDGLGEYGGSWVPVEEVRTKPYFYIYCSRQRSVIVT